MFGELTFEQRMRRIEFRRGRCHLEILESRCFELERKLSRVEWEWPGKNADAKRRLRREQMELRTEVEILKIDIEVFERDFPELLE